MTVTGSSSRMAQRLVFVLVFSPIALALAGSDIRAGGTWSHGRDGEVWMAMVQNADSDALTITCDASEGANIEAMLQSNRAGSLSGNVTTFISIDDETQPVETEFFLDFGSLTVTIGILHGKFNFWFADFLEKLARGKRIAFDVRALDYRAAFPLRGAREALRDIRNRCVE